MSVGETDRESRKNLLQGTLDLVILKALALEPMHGVGVYRRVEQITKRTLCVHSKKKPFSR